MTSNRVKIVSQHANSYLDIRVAWPMNMSDTLRMIDTLRDGVQKGTVQGFAVVPVGGNLAAETLAEINR
jgi:hypothetical protein